MNREQDNTMGFTGLINLGNTCFLNSCIQVLNFTPELSKIIRETARTQPSPDTDITNEWYSLHTLMLSGNYIINPSKFVRTVQQVAKQKNIEVFTGWAQNDICEFLMFMLNSMHTAIKRKMRMRIHGSSKNEMDELAIKCYKYLRDIYATEYSEILETFYGVYVTQIQSIEPEGRTTRTKRSKTLSIRPEHFFVLDLQLFSSAKSICNNLYEAFDLFTQPEHMSDDNAWMNDATGKKEAVNKVVHFWSLPDVLVICLKRFAADGRRKMMHLVDFPLTGLDLSKYVHGYRANTYVYDLYGVCNHFGGVFGGHYTAYVKHPSNRWVHYNDSQLNIIEESLVVSPAAYCLFYRKI